MERSKDPKFEKAFRELGAAVTEHLRSEGIPLDAPVELIPRRDLSAEEFSDTGEILRRAVPARPPRREHSTKRRVSFLRK